MKTNHGPWRLGKEPLENQAKQLVIFRSSDDFSKVQKFQCQPWIGAGKPAAAGPTAAFTLTELVAMVATLGLLLLVVLPTLGSARTNSRQLSCLNNLRQLGIAEHMYVVEYQQYTGSFSPNHDVYVWPGRLLGYAGGQRSLFSCPAAIPSSRWDTNLNSTLGGMSMAGGYDAYAVTPNSCFSYGINDWGLSINYHPQLGLGGDVDGAFYGGPVRDGNVVAPSQMIMIGDVKGLLPLTDTFAANLDPTDGTAVHSQWPSNRHQYQIDFIFTDGHAETPIRPAVIDPANTTWRRRWNNDNLAHNGTEGAAVPTWAPPGAAAAQLDPNY